MCAVVNASQRKSGRIQLVNSVDLDRVVAWLLKHVCVGAMVFAGSGGTQNGTDQPFGIRRILS